MLKLIPAILLAASLPGIAVAQEIPADVHVSFQDLDLHTAAGVKVLDRRLTVAIHKVCPSDASADVWFRIAAERCRTAKRVEVLNQRNIVLAKLSHTNEAIAANR